MDKIKAPGLKRVRRGGKVELYWACSAAARAAGYPIKTAPLSSYGDDADEIVTVCHRLQGDMLIWLRSNVVPTDPYDGTIGGLMRLYQTHEKSPYRKLKPSSLVPYRHYVSTIERNIGKRVILNVIGLDIQHWFDGWSRQGERPAAGQFALSVLKAALGFGAVCGKPECRQLREIIKYMSFAGLQPRQGVFTIEQVNALRASAHKAGRPSVAMATALQFEGALRLWDVIGQWIPLDAPGLSSVTNGGRKWLGLTWGDISPENVLTVTPSKTLRKTAARVVIDLALCPMALEEMALVPPERRVGPVIISEETGLPYEAPKYRRAWHPIAKSAGIPRNLWARDIRASAVTESRQAGASTDDAAKMVGHTKPKTTAEVYDRDKLEATRRVSRARLTHRNTPET